MQQSAEQATGQMSQAGLDYVAALEVMREAAGVVVEQSARVYDEAVIKYAEEATFDEAPERVVDAAEDITYDFAVRTPKAIGGWVDAITKRYTPDAVIEAAEDITQRHSAHKPWSSERPQRVNDMSVEDLTPGSRVVVYNDLRGENMQELARHEVVISEPYIRETSAGKLLIAVLARPVENHATDQTPYDSLEGAREVALSAWGIAPTPRGMYSQTKFTELFVGQTKPLEVPSYDPESAEPLTA